MSRKSSIFIQGLVVVLMLISLFACQAAPAKQAATTAPEPVGKIKVGVVAPLQIALGQQEWYGAEFVANQINAAGGVMVNGKKYEFELKKYDSNEMLSIEDAVSTMSRACNVDKNDFILGMVRSEAVLAMQEVAMDAKKILLDTCSGSNVSVERVAKNYDRYKYYFKVSYSSGINATVYMIFDAAHAAQIIKDQLGIEPRVAFFIEKSANGDEWMAVLNELVPALGWEIVGRWRPGYNDTDLFAMASAVQAARPNLIIGSTNGVNGTAWANAYGKLKIPAVTTGGESEMQNLSFWNAVGGACNYMTAYDAIDRVKMSDLTIPYYDAYLAKYGEKPGLAGAFSDAAIRTLKYAIEKTGSLDNEKLIPVIEKIDIPVLNGRLVFNQIGQPLAHLAKQSATTRMKLSFQWVDGKRYVVYPDGKGVSQKLLDASHSQEEWGDLPKVRYDGTVDMKLPPWMIEYWKKQ